MFAAIATTFFVLVGSAMSPSGAIPAEYVAYHGCMQSALLHMTMTPPSSLDEAQARSKPRYEEIEDRCERFAPVDASGPTANASGSPVDVIVG